MPTIKDVFEKMDGSPAGSLDATVQFDLSGENGGTWHASVSDGNISVAEGAADSPKATIIMDANDFVAMSTGELNAMAAFMSGKVKVEGDLNTVMQLQSVLGL